MNFESLRIWSLSSQKYLTGFVAPAGTNNDILKAQCEHVLAVTEDFGDLAQVQEAARDIKDNLQ